MKSEAHRAVSCQILSLLLLSWSSLAASGECDNPAGKLVSVEGDVSIADRPVLLNQVICNGDAIEVGALSRAAVRLETTQTVVRIDQNSTFMNKPSDAGNSWLELVKRAIYLFSRRHQSETLDEATSLALKGIIPVTRNRLVKATRLAEEVVNAEAAFSVTHTALSYTPLTHFKIEQTLKSATTVGGNNPGNADAVARQAELERGVNDTTGALANAVKAITAAPDDSCAHTSLGFVRLTSREIEGTKAASVHSVARDPGDPVPRRALVLATNRDGRIVAGREYLEFTAALDPIAFSYNLYPDKSIDTLIQVVKIPF